MIQENEVIMLLLGLGVLVFMLVNYRRLSAVKHYSILLAAFLALLAGWTFTVVEGFVFERFFNLLEHVCYAVNSILLALWCGNAFKRAGAE